MKDANDELARRALSDVVEDLIGGRKFGRTDLYDVIEAAIEDDKQIGACIAALVTAARDPYEASEMARRIIEDMAEQMLPMEIDDRMNEMEAEDGADLG